MEYKLYYITECRTQKQNPENFQKFCFGNVTRRDSRKQNPEKILILKVKFFTYIRKEKFFKKSFIFKTEMVFFQRTRKLFEIGFEI